MFSEKNNSPFHPTIKDNALIIPFGASYDKSSEISSIFLKPFPFFKGNSPFCSSSVANTKGLHHKRMGTGQSKDENLYIAVRNGNCDAVKALHREGASLEWADKGGRTPLIVACTRSDLLDMAEALLHLGANLKAYRQGACGGFPLHHATKRGLEKTVSMLLSHGADPLAINDGGLTPLDMARNRGHVAVVRMLEERLCLFSGVFRELSGPRIFETHVPKWVTNKVWVVVLPSESNPGRAAKHEIVIYQAPKVSLWNGVHPSAHPAGLCNVARPRTTISLPLAEIEEPQFNSADPVLCITDKGNKMRYKLLPENEDDQAQLERLYRACKGASQDTETNALSSPRFVHPQQGSSQADNLSGIVSPSWEGSSYTSAISTPEASLPEDMALALALDLSIRSAAQEGIRASYNTNNNIYHPGIRKPQKATKFRGDNISTHDSLGEASSSNYKKDSSPNRPQRRLLQAVPVDVEGQISAKSASTLQYPVIDDAPFDDYPCTQLSVKEGDAALAERGRRDLIMPRRLCVVCWDASIDGLCVPCGHLVGCIDCLTEIKGKNWGCPVCRTEIERIVKVYSA